MTTSHTSLSDIQVPRILVVDDTPDNLFLMNGLFEDRYQVLLASSGPKALEIVMSSEPPDMVLLDIMMPDMDGYEVMRRIRQHPPTAHIPIVFLTALASLQDELLGRELGAQDYLTKPVDPAEVLTRVENLMQATAQARRLEALSEKLARQLPPQDWQLLFRGDGPAAISFERRERTVLYVEPAAGVSLAGALRRHFDTELQWLAARYHGVIDGFIDGAGMVFFDEADPCVRMALDLLQGFTAVRLRAGVHTCTCTVASFRVDGMTLHTLIGPESFLAARVAGTAALGSVAMSQATAALVQQDVDLDTVVDLPLSQY
jgi:CheY-like chemotaxis protein